MVGAITDRPRSTMLQFIRNPMRIRNMAASGGVLSCRRARKYPKKSAQGRRFEKAPSPENPSRRLNGTAL